MILVADGGSSKTAWAVIHNSQKVTYFNTEGINPYFLNQHQTLALLNSAFDKNTLQSCESVFFYGAGFHSMENKKLLHNIFSTFFPSVSQIEVHDDLVGALRATCGKTEGIACILGTGSGSAYGKNGEIIQSKLGNGIWLGDEGSGGYLGKLLLKAYLDNEIPKDLKLKLEKEYNLNRAEILSKIYREEKPNTYLASFAPFIHQHKEDSFIAELIRLSFKLFIQKSVTIYPNSHSTPIHFVGSVAKHFAKELQSVISKNNLLLGKIIPKPIEGLVKYHEFG